MTKEQERIIRDNRRAYEANFDYLSIVEEPGGKGFYVYTDEEKEKHGNYTQYCYNLDYLNGWLYGAVQAANRIMKRKG